MTRCFAVLVRDKKVEGGALAFRDRNKELPNVGEDAATAVEKALEKAIRLGKKESDERDKARKEDGERAFGNAMQQHLTNASTCVVGGGPLTPVAVKAECLHKPRSAVPGIFGSDD